MRHFVTFMRYLCDAANLVPCRFFSIFFFLRRPLIKRKQDVAAGSYKNNESILPKTGIFTHRDELKMAAGAGKSLLCSLCSVFAGTSLRRVIMENAAVWESTSKPGAKILLPKPTVINANSNGYYYYRRHLPVFMFSVFLPGFACC